MIEQLTIIKSAIKANVPLLLEGHTGTGKTFTIMKLAQEQNKTLHVINVSGELTVDSILGQQTLLDGTIVWRDGVLTNAMKRGDWVLFDEMNTALPEVLTIINGVLDDTRSITLPNADNERVEANASFRFIGTQNPSSGQYAGTGRLNDALLNRMIRVTFDYMSPTDEIEALKMHTKLKDKSNAGLVSLAHHTRTSSYDNPLSTRDLVKMLRLREHGNMSIKDATSLILRDKYSNDVYDELYNYFSEQMNALEQYSEGTNEDPLEHIQKEFKKLNELRQELVLERANMKDQVKIEILDELLSQTGKKPESFV